MLDFRQSFVWILQQTLLVVITLVLVVLYNVYSTHGFDTFASINEENCQKIGVEFGSMEDLDIVGDIAFGGSDDFLWIHNGESITEQQKMAQHKTQGKFVKIDLKDDSMTFLKTVAFPHADFHPHGISHFVDSDGSIYLFAVNHRRDGDSVEIFKYDGENEAVNFVKSVTHPTLVYLNDVVATSKNSFYTTRSKYYPPGILNLLETFFVRPWCEAIYCEGNECEVVIPTGIQIMNGISVSPDMKNLYIASPLEMQVHVYDMLSPKNLVHKKAVFVDAMADNMHIDDDGKIWVGTHPSSLGFLFHAQSVLSGKMIPAPSQVVTLDPNNDFKMEIMYSSNAGELAASSVAVHYKDHFYIGAVFDNGILKCKI